MAGEKPDVLLVGARKPVIVKGLEGKVNLHHWLELKDRNAFIREYGDKIRATAADPAGSWKAPSSSRYRAAPASTAWSGHPNATWRTRSASDPIHFPVAVSKRTARAFPATPTPG